MNGYFGSFGGRYVAEVLRQPLIELENAFESALLDPEFQRELQQLASD